jgi:metal-dependent amidase/aminoacylase/carboxypeptidase family protein
MESYGISYPPRAEQEQMSGGSTDAGNISYQVPLVHPSFGIHTTAVNHTHEFTAAAKTEIAHEDTLRATKAMAMTLIDILQSQQMLDAAVAEFEMNTA